MIYPDYRSFEGSNIFGKLRIFAAFGWSLNLRCNQPLRKIPLNSPSNTLTLWISVFTELLTTQHCWSQDTYRLVSKAAFLLELTTQIAPAALPTRIRRQRWNCEITPRERSWLSTVDVHCNEFFAKRISLALQVGPYHPLHDYVATFDSFLDKNFSESKKSILIVFQPRVFIF